MFTALPLSYKTDNNQTSQEGRSAQTDLILQVTMTSLQQENLAGW